MYKASKGDLPKPLIDQYKLNARIHTHNTRQINNPHVKFRRTQLASNQKNHTAPLIWQSIPINLKSTKNIKLFAKLYKKHLLRNQ